MAEGTGHPVGLAGARCPLFNNFGGSTAMLGWRHYLNKLRCSPIVNPDGGLLISLSKGLFAICDEADYEELRWHSWHAVVGSNGHLCAVTNLGRQRRGKIRPVKMHTMLTGWAEVDHVNRNSLDNRRFNLRQCTVGQNCANRGLPSNNNSGYKGVSFHKRKESYCAYVNCGGVRVNLGYFGTAKEAAHVYDYAALILFGEFALTNFESLVV